jgi:hypothetical protein
VPRFDSFREEVKALTSSERIQYQDDASKDPASVILPTTAVEAPASGGGTKK